MIKKKEYQLAELEICLVHIECYLNSHGLHGRHRLVGLIFIERVRVRRETHEGERRGLFFLGAPTRPRDFFSFPLKKQAPSTQAVITNWPQVWEFKSVRYSGFHPVDSGF